MIPHTILDGGVAQLGERNNGIVEVVGSNPISSIDIQNFWGYSSIGRTLALQAGNESSNLSTSINRLKNQVVLGDAVFLF